MEPFTPPGKAPGFFEQVQQAMRPRVPQAAAFATQPQAAPATTAQQQQQIPATQLFAPAQVAQDYSARQVPGQAQPSAASAVSTAAAVPASGNFMVRVQQAMGSAAGAVKAAGQGVAFKIAADPLDALNIGLGVAGALEFATARAPKLPGVPDVYAPTIRPAQGLNATALAGGRAQIQASQRQASRPLSSDMGTNTVQRLFAQAQAGQQQNELTGKDNEAFQQDQRRVDEQQNQAYQANYTTQRSYQEKVFDLGQRAYEARRQQGGAMSQAALTYFTQARADKLNTIERGKESALYAQLGIAPPGYRKPKPASSLATTDANTDKLAKGGKLKLTFGRSRSREQGDMGRNQTAITLQAQRAFNDSVRDASKKRSKGIRS